jgi:tRNA(Ile)-lysidine synthase
LNAIQQQVRRTIRRHSLCPPGARLLVGVSGGSDSVALTRLLLDLAPHGGFSVVSLAHLNHQLRPTAARDEHFCRELAARLGLPIAVEAVDVAAYAASQRLSVEDAARRLRYDFLDRVAAGADAETIAVGHTEDDQAETYLIKLARGAGLAALGGVYPRRGAVVRPLLDVSRAALQDYLLARGERWMDDETNADLANPRNQIRHRVIPELEQAAGGPVRPAIARTAALAREDGQWLDEVAAAQFDALVSRTPDGLRIDADALADAPRPLQRRILLSAMRRLSGGREIGLDHVESAQEVLAGRAAGAEVPGSRLELRGKKLVLIQQGTV